MFVRFREAVLAVVLSLAWPLAVQADQAPVLAAYPCQTGIAGVPLAAAEPQLAAPVSPVYWSLFDAPAGMTIDPVTASIAWPLPTQGVYYITLCATNAAGQDYVEWILHVVTNDFAEPQLYSTSHLDFVAPVEYIQWMQTWQVSRFVDAYWERMRDLLGEEPLDGKQVYQYAPGIGGTLGGNPARAGPTMWTTDPVLGWALAGWSHEVSHNFVARTRVGRLMASNWANSFFDNAAELINIPLEARALEAPDAFGLSGAALANFTLWTQYRQVEAQFRCQAYIQWLTQGEKAETYIGDAAGAWSWILRLLQQQYGPAVLEDAVRALRVDGLPAGTYDLADTPLRQNTLLFCVFSTAAGQDLRPFFTSWGWDVDDAFFVQIQPEVVQTLGALPRTEDDRGWKRSPLNGHHYRLTGWAMTWYEAERAARRLGGHLVTLRSADEEKWLISRLGFEANLWTGFNDVGAEGAWTWTSGEPNTYGNWAVGEPNGGIWANAMLFNSWWGDFQWWVDYATDQRFLGVVERGLLTGLARPDWDRNGTVDNDDAAYFAACRSGPSIPATPACLNKDLDGDLDVDQADFGLFQRCFSGPDVTADPACAG